MTSTTGAITPTLLHVRTAMEALLQPLGWKVLTAETPFQKFAVLAATPDGGICVVSWKGDSSAGQAGSSLVVLSKISVALAARKNQAKPALGPLQGDTPRLFEIHDRVKGAMLSLSIPSEFVPEAGAEHPVYGGAVPLVAPDGVPLDGTDQTWQLELLESFSSEHVST